MAGPSVFRKLREQDTTDLHRFEGSPDMSTVTTKSGLVAKGVAWECGVRITSLAVPPLFIKLNGFNGCTRTVLFHLRAYMMPYALLSTPRLYLPLLPSLPHHSDSQYERFELEYMTDHDYRKVGRPMVIHDSKVSPVHCSLLIRWSALP